VPAWLSRSTSLKKRPAMRADWLGAFVVRRAPDDDSAAGDAVRVG